MLQRKILRFTFDIGRRQKTLCSYRRFQYINVWRNTEETLKHHIKGCFKINGKRTIKSPKQGEYVRLRNLERKTVLRAGGIPVAEDNGKQNPDECYTNKYEKNFRTTNMQTVMDTD